MSAPLRYSMTIQWSDDDVAYLVTLPEWDGRVLNPVTHGNTYEDAVRNGQEAVAALIEAAQARGEALPEPQVFAAA